ncbi:MAG: pantetheine-phosphate adenylyltransferase [Nocardioides sp.]
MRVVCPGSFDPVTLGHLDVIERATALFDQVVVAVGTNPAKARLFSADERIEMLIEACAPMPTVEVVGFVGLLTDFCRERGAVALLKGVRSASDVDFERQMAHMNAHLTGVETILVPASPTYGFVSSSLIKEVASLGGDVSEFLSPSVHRRLLAKFDVA